MTEHEKGMSEKGAGKRHWGDSSGIGSRHREEGAMSEDSRGSPVKTSCTFPRIEAHHHSTGLDLIARHL